MQLRLRALQIVPLAALFLCAQAMAGKIPLAIDYETEGVQYDERIPKPGLILGHQVGTRHTRTDQVVDYFKAIAGLSDRVIYVEHGETYEGRELVHAIVTSPENHSRLEEIRKQNLRLSDAPDSVDNNELQTIPVIVTLGYSVHGNEASGSEAALLVLYHLAAGSGSPVEQVLENCVVIIDPMLNPDGRSRFVNWVNGNRGRVANTDPEDREHREPWPGGRTNHYWFDLNRDWLPAQLKESQARLELFHKWRPQIYTDFHEMGSDSTFFFQPGVPSRTNPNTPEATTDLTREIAAFHAKALDRIGSLYYSEEQFDDFFYGKGSTYPDINGSVGILFEQASSRSLIRETSAGKIDYPFTIRNQLTASLSTLEAAVALRVKLLVHQKDFYSDAQRIGKENPIKAYLFEKDIEGKRAYQMAETLLYHRIRVYELTKELRVDGRTIKAGGAFLVPTEQGQTRLLHALMDTVTEFGDSIFYDISTWTLPLAFGITPVELKELDRSLLGEEILSPPYPVTATPSTRADYAYILDWDQPESPSVLYQLLAKDFRIRLLMADTQLQTNDGIRNINRSSLIVPVIQPTRTRQEVEEQISWIEDRGVSVSPAASGLTPDGPDLGGPSTAALTLPVVGVVCGSGTLSYQVGSTWFVLNELTGIPVSLLELRRLDRLELERYNTLVLVSGTYSSLSSDTLAALKQWVRNGGLLIAFQSAAKWLIEHEFINETLRQLPTNEKSLSYAEARNSRRSERIPGSIFSTAIDSTHPIAFGLGDSLAMFKNSDTIFEPSKVPGATVARYSEQPLLSGYVPNQKLASLGGGASVIARRLGRGSIVLFADDPNFRAFWKKTSRMFLNTVFFGRSF